MQYGYVVRDNDLGIQTKALNDYGCRDIFDDQDIRQVISRLKPGDTLVVWRLDKLANTIASMQQTLDAVHAAGATVWSLNEKFNSGSASKDLLYKLMDVIAAAEK